MNQIYLYVALVGVVLVLFALTRSNKGAVHAAASTMPAGGGMSDLELKQTLDEFMQELDKENVQMLESFTKLQIEIRQKFDEQQQAIQGLERQLSRLADRQDQLEKQAAEQQAALAESVTAAPNPEQLAEPDAPSQQAASSFAFNEKYAKVVELSRQGMTADQIARETDIGIGEIQLVLDLARREER